MPKELPKERPLLKDRPCSSPRSTRRSRSCLRGSRRVCLVCWLIISTPGTTSGVDVKTQARHIQPLAFWIQSATVGLPLAVRYTYWMEDIRQSVSAVNDDDNSGDEEGSGDSGDEEGIEILTSFGSVRATRRSPRLWRGVRSVSVHLKAPMQHMPKAMMVP